MPVAPLDQAQAGNQHRYANRRRVRLGVPSWTLWGLSPMFFLVRPAGTAVRSAALLPQLVILRLRRLGGKLRCRPQALRRNKQLSRHVLTGRWRRSFAAHT